MYVLTTFWLHASALIFHHHTMIIHTQSRKRIKPHGYLHDSFSFYGWIQSYTFTVQVCEKLSLQIKLALKPKDLQVVPI